MAGVFEIVAVFVVAGSVNFGFPLKILSPNEAHECCEVVKFSVFVQYNFLDIVLYSVFR